LLSSTEHFFRGTDGYEAARRATVWNGLVPDRFPDVIVRARDAGDVVAAVRYARANGYQVGIRSGGHSWAASHLRDGGVLLDVSRLDHCTVDTDRMTAVVGPGKKASVFALELDSQGFFFPAGHCEDICLGGYLLQGGYGWNSKALGLACESVLGLQVATADGELIYCDAENHPDLYWAARDVFSWARPISSEIDERVELQILTARSFPQFGLDHAGITIASPVFAESEEQAEKSLAVLRTCPVVDQAIAAISYAPTGLADWYAAVMTNYPTGHRYVADNMFTSASAEELLPGIRKIIETMPPHPSHFIFTGWKPSTDRRDMVFGLDDEIYMALYTVWQDAAEDERYRDWAGSNMASMSDLATCMALADENLGRRPARFISDANMARLDKVRATYDPDGRFHSWMGCGQ